MAATTEMKRVRFGTHATLHIQTGDTVRVGEAVGTVTHVNLRWNEDGTYGTQAASYRVSDGDGYTWVRDDQITGVIYA